MQKSLATPDAPLARGIDASLFADDDGAVYFLHGSGHLARMNDDLTGLAETPVRPRCNEDAPCAPPSKTSKK